MQLESLRTSSLVDRAYEQLRSQILSGAIPAGSKLPTERELAETLHVNRQVVREALKRLEFLELVEVRHGQGAFVQALSASSALQLIEALLRDPAFVTLELLEQLLVFRRHVTLSVVGLAAHNRNDEQLARARQLLEDEAAEGTDPKRALDIDLRWNALLGEATANLLYQLVTNLFTKLVARLGPLYYNEDRDHVRSMANHRDLLRAIETRDAEAAVRLVGEMLRYSEDRIRAEAERLADAGVIRRSATGARP